jgi:hypothetical protein
MACPFFNRGCASNSEKVTSIVEFYSTHARKASRRHSCRQFDQKCADPYNGGFTVKHFFRFDELFFQPGGNPLGCVVLWRLFRGAHSSDVRLE